MRIALSKCSLKPIRLILISIAATAAAFGSLGSFAIGQELRNAIRDYRDERVFNYQPNDPQYRGKIFNVHTKHYGRFYNCDNQEDKRNSPHIYWKPHFENDFPPRLGFRENLRRDINEIKQRISDGAGACQGSCGCKQCQSTQQHQVSPAVPPAYSPPSDCSCVQCAASTNLRSSSSSKNLEAASQTQTQPAVSKQLKKDSSLGENYGERKYGLLSGKILQPTTLPQTNYSDPKESDQDQVEFVSRLPQEDLAPKTKQLSSRSTVATQVKDSKVSSTSFASQIKQARTNALKTFKRPESRNRNR